MEWAGRSRAPVHASARGLFGLAALRSSNPLRRNSQRRPLQPYEPQGADCHYWLHCRRLTVVVRQLCWWSSSCGTRAKALESNPRLNLYLERFRQHFRQRMNPRRAGVMAYDTDDKLNQLAISLLEQLLFCTGTAGEQRLWISLFDGEV
ncbi:MAG: DUF3038 domain-containing protein [Synechococcales cyanobacterium CRU_2_2]|nr:DUF3038 domain-containing protein [Synechococcales cyanobacterium CRU_2_2]